MTSSRNESQSSSPQSIGLSNYPSRISSKDKSKELSGNLGQKESGATQVALSSSLRAARAGAEAPTPRKATSGQSKILRFADEKK